MKLNISSGALALSAVLAIAVVLVFAVGLANKNNQADRDREQGRALVREGNLRVAQFCKLTNSGHNERIERLDQTRKFLAAPAGKESSALNTAIKANLPALTRVATLEERNLPPDCRRLRTRAQAALARRVLSGR